ncbi:hypothetical protein PR048_024514 [Dryococelus australis]|uniref:Uncharacterized protein n=1 Tax=Dryococelus australis TaxID=614101 RepID=A0ABQ9GNW1_9NEOP|nr:hypothetical protein PR048_024514 [Dryococelus australis]
MRNSPVVSLLASHLGEPGSIPGGITPGFSHVKIVPNDAVGRWVYSGISRFPHPYIPALLHTHLASPSSALKTTIPAEFESRVLIVVLAALLVAWTTCCGRGYEVWGYPGVLGYPDYLGGLSGGYGYPGLIGEDLEVQLLLPPLQLLVIMGSTIISIDDIVDFMEGIMDFTEGMVDLMVDIMDFMEGMAVCKEDSVTQVNLGAADIQDTSVGFTEDIVTQGFLEAGDIQDTWLESTKAMRRLVLHLRLVVRLHLHRHHLRLLRHLRNLKRLLSRCIRRRHNEYVAAGHDKLLSTTTDCSKEHVEHSVARGHDHVVVSLLASHQGESGSFPGAVSPRFSHVGIMPGDTAGRRVFLGISRPHALAFRRRTILTSLHPLSTLKTSMLRASQISSLFLCRQLGADYQVKKLHCFERITAYDQKYASAERPASPGLQTLNQGTSVTAMTPCERQLQKFPSPTSKRGRKKKLNNATDIGQRKTGSEVFCDRDSGPRDMEMGMSGHRLTPS